MNKLTKIGAMGLAALALGLSGAAQAAETRSGAAMPVAAKKALKRTVPLAGAKRSKIGAEEGLLIAGGLTAVAVGTVALTDNGDSAG